jgi:hypothetical protein
MKTCRFIYSLMLVAVLICSIHFAYAGSFSDMVKGRNRKRRKAGIQAGWILSEPGH